MERTRVETSDLKKMIADYMENGLLENIVDMFKHDKSLYEYVADLLKDERMRVRIGTAALLETLEKEDPEDAKRAVPSILPLLKDQNPVVRGDAAYLLGVIGDKSIIPFLEGVIDDNDNNVRTIAAESIEDIRSKFESAS
jgi:HEAT repeat protein